MSIWFSTFLWSRWCQLNSYPCSLNIRKHSKNSLLSEKFEVLSLYWKDYWTNWAEKWWFEKVSLFKLISNHCHRNGESWCLTCSYYSWYTPSHWVWLVLFNFHCSRWFKIEYQSLGVWGSLRHSGCNFTHYTLLYM